MRQHLVGAGTSLTQKIKDVMGCDECIAEYEDIKKSSRVNSAGRASYVERNQWMVEDSTFIVIYISKELKERLKSTSRASLLYKYVVQCKKKIYLC